MAIDNSNKFINFTNGEPLTDVQLDLLQKLFADEQDAILSEVVGNGAVGTAIGTVGWTVTQSGADPSRNVSISAGAGSIQGQRVTSPSPTVLTNLANNAVSKVYVSADATVVYSAAVNSWIAVFGHTTGAIPAGSMEIAQVTVASNDITAISHTRFILESHALASSAIDDTVTAASVARSYRERFNHFAWLFKQVIDASGTWLTAVPISLSALWAKFNGTSGHKHTGVDGDGAKIAAADVLVTPAGSIASAQAQAALQELDTEKLARSGGTMTGPIVVNYPITQPSHGASVEFVRNFVGGGPNSTHGNFAPNLALTTSYQLIATLTLTTLGGKVLLLPESSIMVMGDFTGTVNRSVDFRIKRNSVDLRLISPELKHTTSTKAEILGHVCIPVILDDAVVNLPAAYTYTIEAKVSSVTNFSAATPFITGRWNAIEVR